DPGIEPVGISELPEIPPGSDQPFLNRVACELRVPKDEAGRLVQPHDDRAGELGKGVMIASPCALHESSLVHGRLAYEHGPRARAYSVWRPDPDTGSRGLDMHVVGSGHARRISADRARSGGDHPHHPGALPRD